MNKGKKHIKEKKKAPRAKPRSPHQPLSKKAKKFLNNTMEAVARSYGFGDQEKLIFMKFKQDLKTYTEIARELKLPLPHVRNIIQKIKSFSRLHAEEASKDKTS